MSAVCLGDYIYTLNVFGSERSINDTWNLTISDTNFKVGVGLRIQQTKYNSYLPSVEYQGSSVEGGDYNINVNGDLAQTFGNLVKPDEQEIRGIVNNSIQTFASSIIPPKLQQFNAQIPKYLARLNISDLVTYQPDFYTLPPDVLAESIRFYFRGDIFLNPIGYQTVSYPAFNLTFSTDN